jgi:hypothetical protein
MASESERPIEKELNAYAQKRRAQAGEPFALDPTTRRRLQDEVAQTVAQPQESPASGGGSWFDSLWLRLAVWGYACAMIALLAVILLQTFPEQTDSVASAEHETNRGATLSETDVDADTYAEGVADASVAEPLPSVESARLGAEREKLKLTAPAERSSNRALRPSARPELSQPSLRLSNGNGGTGGTAQTTAYYSLAESQRSVQRRLRESPSVDEEHTALFATPFSTNAFADQMSLAFKPPLPETPESAGTSEEPSTSAMGQYGLASVKPEAEAEAQEPAATPQQFLQVNTNYRRNLNSPPMPDVLQSFRLEQSGETLRVIDQDGSTYEGRIQPLQSSPETVVGTAVIRPEKAVTDQADSGTAGYSFRVTGTNQSLNQQVVFKGNYLNATNQSRSSQPSTERFSGSRSRGRQIAPEPPEPLIQGQVVIGESNQLLHIEAVPAEP